jgi:hypothetical protein
MSDWTVEVRCPHGFKVLMGFDTLGYLTRPHPAACDEHLSKDAERAVKRADAGEPIDPVVVRPGWFKLWNEARKARKALRNARPDDWANGPGGGGW